MEVLIIEKKTGKVVATYPIIEQGMNYAPTELEYLNSAWKSAVEDGVVDQERKAEYIIKSKDMEI